MVLDLSPSKTSRFVRIMKIERNNSKVEYRNHNPFVAGSSPVFVNSFVFRNVTQLVACPFWEWKVVCSSHTIPKSSPLFKLMLFRQKHTYIYMQTLHCVLNFVLVVSSLFVLTSDNPIHSILFLILVFCNASAILFLFGLEFLALAFVMIYVGAIAVLFLFVVMMLNLKAFNLKTFVPYNFFVYITAVFSWTALYLSIESYFFGLDDPFNDDYFKLGESALPQFGYAQNFDGMNNIDVLGQVLFNYFTPCFLVAGLLLLVAMVSAIVLTLDFCSNRKSELCHRQLSRSDNFLSFLK